MSELLTGYLSDLTDEQLAFSALFLEDVFYHNRQYLSSYDADQIDTIRVVIKSAPSTAMKYKLLSALDPDIQLHIVALFDGASVLEFFRYHQDKTFVKRVFQTLKAPLQQDVLQSLYKDKKNVYQLLKPLVGHDMSMIGGILVKDEQVVSQFIEKEKLTLLSKIVSQRHSTIHMDAFGKELNGRYEKHDLAHLCSVLIASFTHKNIPINSTENFGSHIKFYHFLVPYLIMFPELNQHIIPAMDQFLVSLHRMPNDEWVVKLLNQLPQTIIQNALERLGSFESVGEFKKRQIYSTLFKSVKANIHHSFADKVKLAYQTL